MLNLEHRPKKVNCQPPASCDNAEMRRLTLFAVLGFLTASTAHADDIYTVIVKKQEQKKLSKWSLSDWLDTRNRMRLMDMWLALHTPSPFEFYLGGNYQAASADGNTYKGGAFQVGAFATIFGLEFERDQSNTKIMNGLFLLRLFGLHNQTTNITLHGGVRFRGAGNEFHSPVAGVRTDLYFTKYFGLEGLYRRVFNSNVSNGARFTANRYEAGAFIDFKFLRLYGSYFNEQEFANAAQYQNAFPLRKGALMGVRLFF